MKNEPATEEVKIMDSVRGAFKFGFAVSGTLFLFYLGYRIFIWALLTIF